MSSREAILAAVAANKPAEKPLPTGLYQPESGYNLKERFIENVSFIGGKVHTINDIATIKNFTNAYFNGAKRVITNVTTFKDIATLSLYTDAGKQMPHELENVDLTVLNAHFGVAENGAIWVTEELLYHRVLPFITQHLILIIKEEDVVASLQDAYARIGHDDYGYGVFISGPSKTADIEQSLVIGAHGSRSLDVFIINAST